MKWIAPACLLLLAPLAALGQPAASPVFEVASVKLHSLPPGTFAFGPGGGGQGIGISGNRVTCLLNTLTRLIMSAYDVRDFQVSGVPDWARARGQFYDIVAKTEGEATPTLEQVRPMLRALLADRFQLKIHRETKELPVYDLVLGKNGPALKASAGPRSQSAKYKGPGPLMEYNLFDRTMADLVLFLAPNLDRPVLDKTGSTGRYDFTLEFTRVDPDSVSPDNPDPDRPIFRAVQQLGLKLVPAREPAEILVIDRVERPSAN